MRTLHQQQHSDWKPRQRSRADVPEVHASARLRLFPDLDPALERKVDALRAVEAEVKAGVVSTRERNDELAGLLDEVVGLT